LHNEDFTTGPVYFNNPTRVTQATSVIQSTWPMVVVGQPNEISLHFRV